MKTAASVVNVGKAFFRSQNVHSGMGVCSISHRMRIPARELPGANPVVRSFASIRTIPSFDEAATQWQESKPVILIDFSLGDPKDKVKGIYSLMLCRCLTSISLSSEKKRKDDEKKKDSKPKSDKPAEPEPAKNDKKTDKKKG
jgi:hypothetical protein